jgi:hypothetical protein
MVEVTPIQDEAGHAIGQVLLKRLIDAEQVIERLNQNP